MTLRISPEGLFITCFESGRKQWELHPDDIVAVGFYADPEIRQVLVGRGKEHVIPVDTPGVAELNEILERHLGQPINTPATATREGMTVWPPHLSGCELWTFFQLDKAGFAHPVDSFIPGALNGLSRPLAREQVFSASIPHPIGFPQRLKQSAFVYHGYSSWRTQEAFTVLEWLAQSGISVELY
jgi:hypothetical protein